MNNKIYNNKNYNNKNNNNNNIKLNLIGSASVMVLYQNQMDNIRVPL